MSSQRLRLLIGYLVSQTLAAPTVPSDPCAAIAHQKWAAPSEVRACFNNAPLNDTIRQNIVDVLEKFLPFHTSINYQIQAPDPFTKEVHEDIVKDLGRIRHQDYNTDYELHLDLVNSFRRTRDGHFSYNNQCYDYRFVTVLPTPLVHLTDDEGKQAVHIAPIAHTIISSSFEDQVSVWEEALPEGVDLKSLEGAEVLEINEKHPYKAVDMSADAPGSNQWYATRQNSFFASYELQGEWKYVLGDFAQKSLPVVDSVKMKVKRKGASKPDTFTIPYRSYLVSTGAGFRDTKSFRTRCAAPFSPRQEELRDLPFPMLAKDPSPNFTPFGAASVDEPMGILQDSLFPSDTALPAELKPASPETEIGSFQFYMLDDGVTGVFVIGSFASSLRMKSLQQQLLEALQDLKEKGAKHLLIDMTNNPGGLICAATFSHRLLAGNKRTTVPQPGLDTKIRAGPLAKVMVQKLAAGADEDLYTVYNSANHTFVNGTWMPASYNYMAETVDEDINGHPDSFTQRMGTVCQAWEIDLPDEPMFEHTKMAIMSNGRCASSCSLFSVTMAKAEGVRTVVVGGRKDEPQHYCGTVGGQSLSSLAMSFVIDALGLKDHELAPPEFLTNSGMGFTFSLGFGIDDPNKPEEWQDHTATVNFPLTFKTVNNPIELWKAVAAEVFSQDSMDE